MSQATGEDNNGLYPGSPPRAGARVAWGKVVGVGLWIERAEG